MNHHNCDLHDNGSYLENPNDLQGSFGGRSVIGLSQIQKKKKVIGLSSAHCLRNNGCGWAIDSSARRANGPHTTKPKEPQIQLYSSFKGTGGFLDSIRPSKRERSQKMGGGTGETTRHSHRVQRGPTDSRITVHTE